MEPTKQEHQEEAQHGRVPFHISLGMRLQSFQLAQISFLDGLPAAADVIFTDTKPGCPDHTNQPSLEHQG